MLGVVNDAPVPRGLPPVDAEYQVSVPALVVAPSIIVPTSQIESGIVPVIDGVVVTVATTGVLEVVIHPLVVVST